MWLLWIISVVLFLYGLKLIKNWDTDVVGFSITMICGVFLFLSLLFWPIEYYETKATIAVYPEMVKSIESARRGEISEFERMALTQTIIQFNMELKRKQYWNETFIFDIYVPDEIMDIEPIY